MTVSPLNLAGADLELEHIARSLAADTELWQPFVRFAEPRVRVRLNDSPDFEMSLLTWKPGQSTGYHDHGGSTGALTVVHGVLSESFMEGNGRTHDFHYCPGQATSFNLDIIHDLRNVGSIGAISLHVYRPTIQLMRKYAASPNGPLLIETKYAGIDW